MSSVTFLYNDNGEGKEEIYLSKKIIEIINDESKNKIYFGLVLIDSLSKVINTLETNENHNKVRESEKSGYRINENHHYSRCRIFIEKISDDGVKEVRLEHRIDENYHYKLYKMFIEKIIQSKFKNIYIDDLKEEDFVKGIYAVTLEGIDINIVANLNEYLVRLNKFYIGYCCFDNEDKLIKKLLYDNMYNAVIMSRRLVLADNIYFQDSVIEIIGEDKCEFIDEYSNKVQIDEVIDEQESYNSFDNFWDNFTCEVLDYVLKNDIPVENNIKIQSEVSFDFNYLKDMTSKLTEYCLNYKHDVGKNKAEVFERVLSIKGSDYKFLKKQIKQGFIFNKIKIKNIDKYGIGFQINIPILGKNNMKVWMTSAWKYKEQGNEKFHLTTAYILQKNKQTNISNMNLQLWIGSDNCDSQYYSEVYEIADKYRQIISDKYMLKDNKSNKRAALQIKDENFGAWLMSNYKAEKYKGNILIFDDYKRDIYSLSVVFEINDISTKIIDI